MAFLDTLNDSLTKERGGRHGGKGHEFQRYWALCHLLKVDLEKDNYLFLLEFIEDVAVLNDEVYPTEIDLFQLKKKEGAGGKWTKTTLSKPPKVGKSILTKLHESQSIVKNETKIIAFVSNAPVDLKLITTDDSTTRSEFLGSDIDPVLSNSLRQSIAKELGVIESDIDFSSFKFVRSPLAIDDLENHAIGRVSSYLAEKFPDHVVRADVFCKALYSEIKIKATSTEDAGTFEDLGRIRGISKSQFTSMLSITLSRRPDSEIISFCLANLAQENVPYNRREAIKRAARQFLVEKAGIASDVLASLKQLVSLTLQSVPDHLVTSWDVANWVVDQVMSSSKKLSFGMLEKDYLLAAVLYWMEQ
ncbi:DUF4297 domain-containing protein [Deefgea sp. CFH1-16]|uniref:DUF4297 domain-containing protein n=1 Tax=Deefgea sp. CFH1-16 TaxID=2675457 RepID=UPI0015F60427|nr:DUF4297 domain-containing protein [Deefgea sp. CFH1-16]MBM5573645.1 DUF4297 domain-containing protein [Deefgea sp. CFH1-16]